VVLCLTSACTRAPQRTASAKDGDPISALLAAGGNLEVDLETRRNLERVRTATSAFQDITAAQAAGYPTNIPQCLENPDQGAMGQHYMNRMLLDARLDVERPEILLYAPLSDGRQKLLGVEYIVPFSKWESEQPPRIFGQALKRSAELELWYLHVWAWEPNSRGLFADWNPAVKC
jgi:hypothetical protein